VSGRQPAAKASSVKIVLVDASSGLKNWSPIMAAMTPKR
jgi:hypothetical protein